MFRKPVPLIWRWMKRANRRLAERVFGAGKGPAHLVLLLTTTGRKSGLLRVTPLQYEEVEGVIYVASARGQEADWFCNIVANPRVHIQIQNRQFDGLAEPMTEAGCVADFLEMRLRRHPVMLRLLLSLEGLPWNPDRAALESFARGKALVVIRPQGDSEQ